MPIDYNVRVQFISERVWIIIAEQATCERDNTSQHHSRRSSSCARAAGSNNATVEMFRGYCLPTRQIAPQIALTIANLLGKEVAPQAICQPICSGSCRSDPQIDRGWRQTARAARCTCHRCFL